jgi:hypothetical protein
VNIILQAGTWMTFREIHEAGWDQEALVDELQDAAGKTDVK